MGLLLVAAVISANVISAADIDLASETIYVSEQARAAIADGSVARLACLDLPKRSRKYRTACLTPAEWDQATRQSARAVKRSRTTEEMNGLPYSAPPIPAVPYQSYGH